MFFTSYSEVEVQCKAAPRGLLLRPRPLAARLDYALPLAVYAALLSAAFSKRLQVRCSAPGKLCAH